LKNSPPRAPAHLSNAAKTWWRRIVREYAVDDQAGCLLLQTALEAFDRMKGAQAQITTEGATVRDRFGQTKPHPLLTVERDARAQMLMALKQLNLDVEPEGDGP